MYYCILLLIRLIVIASCEEFNIKFKQDDYDIKDVRIDMIFYNRRYMKDLKGDLVIWNNETDLPRLHNVTFQLLKEIPEDLEVKLDVFKLMGNEYRYFPIHLVFDMCVECRRNKDYIIELLTKENVMSNLLNGCPYKPGVYYVYNVKPNYGMFPPFIPHGSYKVMGKLHHKSDLIGEVNIFGTVVGKLKKNHRKH